MPVKVAHAVADAVEQEGIQAVFGLMGDANMFFMQRLHERGVVKVYDARHEGSAVSMADGYARASGGVGVATVTCGPGVAQLGTALNVASRHRSPIVVVGGDVSTAIKGMGSRHDFDQRAFVEACGCVFHQLRSPSSVAADLQHSFALARAQRRPVFLNCPVDIQGRDLVGELGYVPSRSRLPPVENPVAPARSIERAADMFVAARRPVIVAGLGAVESDCRDLIDRLGARVGAALATTLRAKGYLDGPWGVGVCGTFATIPAQSIFAAADLVVLVGASGNADTAHAIPASARTLHINLDPSVGVGGRRPEHTVCGDARAALEAIEALLSEAEFTSRGFRTGAYDDLFSADPIEADLRAARWPVEAGALDPRQVIRELDRALPRECSVVIASGHFSGFPWFFLNGHRSRRFFGTYDFGCIGQGLPTAIGIAVALPERPVILFEGDASVMMQIHEMDTTARYRPRLLVFVMNDQALGAEYQRLRGDGLDPRHAIVPTPNFAELAIAFGNAGARVTAVEQVAKEVQAFASDARTRYVDVRVSRSVVSPSYRDQFPSLAAGAQREAPISIGSSAPSVSSVEAR